MEKSVEINELAKALTGFNQDMETVGFDASNPFFKSKYATLTQLVKMAKPVLVKHGLAVSQLAEDEGAITTILMHNSGQYLSSKLTLKPVKDDPQGRGSCLTYSRRYSYASILGLVSDEDDDGNNATHGKEKNKEVKVEVPAPPITEKDRLLGTGISKFGSEEKFKAWLKENNLKTDIENMSGQDVSFALAVLREYKPLNRIATKA